MFICVFNFQLPVVDPFVEKVSLSDLGEFCSANYSEFFTLRFDWSSGALALQPLIDVSLYKYMQQRKYLKRMKYCRGIKNNSTSRQ